LFGTDKGTLKMCDLRQNSNSNEAVGFASEKVTNKNFFTELVSSYSSTQFIKKGKYVAARDYLTVKIWDSCNPSKPIQTIPIQESIKSKLCDLFENDSIYDKFTLYAS
jgi:serine/threonine-protein phosphatase 2A regulatory subunit B